MLIPEIVLARMLDIGIQAVRLDYNQRLDDGHVSRSFLYVLFKGLKLGNYDFFDNAVKVVVTTDENPKHVRVRLAYDPNMAASPQIFISCPSETDKNNTLGVGIREENLLKFNNFQEQDESLQVLTRRYQTTYHITIVAENKQEATIFYHLVKALVTALLDHVAFEGLENVKIGGGDLRMETVPGSLFMKAVTLNLEYNQEVPELQTDAIFRIFNLYWKPEGAEVAQGPITIENSDDISESTDDDSD